MFCYLLEVMGPFASYDLVEHSRYNKEHGGASKDHLFERTSGRLSLNQAVETGLKVQAWSNSLYSCKKGSTCIPPNCCKKRKSNVNYYMFLWGLHGKILFTIEAIKENLNQSEWRLVEPRPSRCFYKTPLHLSPREHCRKGCRKSVRARWFWNLLWECVS